MDEFKIITAEGAPVVVNNGKPSGFAKYEISNCEAYWSKDEFGGLFFQHYNGCDFDIWNSNYLIKKPCGFIGTANTPVLELQIPLLNQFESSWDGMEHVEMREHQFEVTYTPFVKTFSRFLPDKNYQTFDVHFTVDGLMPFALHCRLLDIFLQKVIKQQPANLLNMVQFIHPDMLKIVHSIINYDGDENFGKLYFNVLIQELLVLLTMQVAKITDRPAFTNAEIKQAEEARKIILGDFEMNYTIKELAKMTGANDLKLQMVFKHLFGMTLYKFSKHARLEYAYSLLQRTNHPLRVICLMAGYPDAPNFAIAFKNEYGFPPGKIQKCRKEDK